MRCKVVLASGSGQDACLAPEHFDRNGRAPLTREPAELSPAGSIANLEGQDLYREQLRALRQKLAAYASQCRDPDSRRANALMLDEYFGSGLANGGT